MPSSSKKSSKKKEGEKKERTKLPFKPLSKKCSYCNAEPANSKSLHDCSRCGMAAYCNRQCQLAAYPEHKLWCKHSAKDHPIDDVKGKRRILFSRRFGGAVSLLMKEGYERFGCGLIHAKCSHPFQEYCERRRSEEDTRSITLTYVPKGEKLRILQQEVVADHQPKADDEGDGMLEIAIDCNNIFCHNSSASSAIGDLSDGRCCAIALEQHGVKFIHPVHFVSYMTLDHPAHDWFRMVLDVNPGEDMTLTLNWDWDPEATGVDQDEDHPLQWLYKNAIGPRFYRECSLAWQEKRRNADCDTYSPWPGGVLTPPLALEIGLTVAPKRK